MRPLSILVAASLTLGAASPRGSAALECRLPYREAVTALDRLPVQAREDLPGEDEYHHWRKFDPARLAAFGFPARASNALKVDSISHEALVVTTTLRGPYASIRAAALASRGKSDCASTDGPPRSCEIEERDDAGWRVDFLLEDVNGDPVISCLYTRPSA